MNYLKRAARSLLYYRKNTLLLFCVFLIMGVIIQSGLCILSASRQSAAQLRNSIGATVLVKNDNVTSGDIYYGKNLICTESMNKVALLPEVADFNPLAYSMGKGTSIFKSYVEESQSNKFPDSNEFRIQGCYDASLLNEFISGDLELIMGRNLKKGDRRTAVISSDVASRNQVTVGDSFQLEAYYDGEDVTLTIIGIYKVNEPLPHTDVPFYNSENLILTDPDTIFTLNNLDKVYTISYHITDPTKTGEFIKKVQKLDLSEDGNITFLIDDNEYRSMASTINSMIRISFAMVTASMIMSGIILTLLVMIQFKDRNHEIGILLSIGERKVNIIIQIIVEILVPILLAATGAICISIVTARQITAFLGGGEKISISIRPLPVIAMYLCGILLTIIASASAIWRILHYHPKQMLMEMQ